MKTTASTTTEAELPSVRSEPLLAQIRQAWIDYDEQQAEYLYHQKEGGDTDLTNADVERAWDRLNTLIMGSSNDKAHRRQTPQEGNA